MKLLLPAALLTLVLALPAGLITRRRWLQVALGLAIWMGGFTLAGRDVTALWAVALAGAATVLALLAGADGLLRKFGRTEVRPGDSRTAFRRHLTGDVSGWRAAWHLVVVGVGLLFLTLLVDDIDLTSWSRLGSAFRAACPIAWYSVALWWVVGSWRAARKREFTWRGRTGAWMLRAAALLLVVPAVSEGHDALERVKGNWDVAFGPPESEAFRLRILRAGAELEIAGTLGFGVSEAVERTLRANPGIRLLHLDSPGGRVFEGARLGGLARSRGLTTYVAKTCSSACVLAFAGGKERLLKRAARIGLHQPSAPGESRLERERGADQYVERLVKAGVDESFAREAMRTGPNDIWFPDRERLLGSRLATRLAGRDDAALSGWTEDELQRLPLFLRESPLLEFLYEYERSIFDRIAEGLQRGIGLGLSYGEAVPFQDTELKRIAAEGLPRASDDRILAVLRRSLEVIAPDARGIDCDSLDADGPLEEAYSAALRSSRDAPRPAPSLAEVQGDLLTAYLGAGSRSSTVATIELRPGSTWTTSERCRLGLAIYAELVRMPPHRAGPAARYLLGRAMQGDPWSPGAGSATAPPGRRAGPRRRRPFRRAVLRRLAGGR